MQTVSDFILSRLAQWGIQRVYGYPGDGINGLIGAFGRTSEPLEFVQARHEEMATLMACAHAKFTGQVGPAWDRAIEADRPVLLEMVTDPEVPLIPPHVPLKQVRNYVKALRQEDASGGAALRATLKQWWAG